MMRAAVIQTHPEFGNREKNFDQVRGLAEGIRADLLVLPELFASGYNFSSSEEVSSLAEETDGVTAEFCISLAASIGGAVVAGFPERDGDRLYNSSLLADGNGILGTYRKIHLFAREKLFFQPGNRPFQVYRFDWGILGIMICYDWLFPEAARSLALAGANIIAHPANLVLPYGQENMRVRCLENRVFAVTANRVGREDRGGVDLSFTGMSQILGCSGEILVRMGGEGTGMRVLELDLTESYNKKVTGYNDIFDDLRPDMYLSKKVEK